MFKDEVDFNFMVNLLLPYVKPDKSKIFEDAVAQVFLEETGDLNDPDTCLDLWTEEDRISELFFQLS